MVWSNLRPGPRLVRMCPISIAICCANAADTLEQACRSARWADELVIVDSGSTDATGQIARQYADQYVVESWRGYSMQKKFSADLCRNDWVFILDGDEEISEPLTKEIQSLAADLWDRVDVFRMPRRNYVMGRPVRAWSPDLQSRLVHRKRCQWGTESLHDARRADDPSRVRMLRGWIDHKRHSQAGFADYFGGRRLDERLLMVAQEMHDQGKRCRPWDLVLRPWVAFWKFYLLKRGFLDGVFGLLIAQKAAVSTQLKYAALWAVQAKEDRPTHRPADPDEADAPRGSSP